MKNLLVKYEAHINVEVCSRSLSTVEKAFKKEEAPS
jgi:hypothetical protein